MDIPAKAILPTKLWLSSWLCALSPVVASLLVRERECVCVGVFVCVYVSVLTEERERDREREEYVRFNVAMSCLTSKKISCVETHSHLSLIYTHTHTLTEIQYMGSIGCTFTT